MTRRPGWLDTVVCGVLPGALAGTQIAGLLFFLNPALPFAPAPLLRGLAIYAALLGAVSLAFHLPATWSRPQRARRILPWTLTAVLALAALMDWAHASYFAYYLPPGINERLLKAGLWLTLAALIGFYTALLHSLNRRAYGRRSQLAFFFLGLAAIYVVLERREAFRPRREPPPPPASVEPQRRPRLFVVGLESATLDAVLPLAEQGQLPFFHAALQQGAYARLSSLEPTRRGPLWTTLATGKYPYKHGIVARQSFAASFLAPGAELQLLPRALGFRSWGTFGARPRLTDARARRALPLWEVLARLGMNTGVVGWPVSSPASGGASFVVADSFFRDDPPPDAVVPDEIASRAGLFRTTPADIDPARRAGFGAGAPEVVFTALAEDLWRESLATFLLEERKADVVFLSLPGLAEVSADLYGGYAAVQFEGAQQALLQDASQAVAAYYAHLDDFLAGLWGGADRPDLLAVVSAYGCEAPSGWRQVWGEVLRHRSLAGRMDEGPDGLLLLLGTGVRPGVFLRRAHLVDLPPTLFYALGFPVPRDHDGQVLTGALDPAYLARQPLTFLPSYEGLAER